MGLIRWDPGNELISLREAMNRLFEESFVRQIGPGGRLVAEGATRLLPVDIYETERDIVVKASVPGVKPEDVEISVLGDTVTIRGEIKQDSEVKRENYLRVERHYGSFSRQFQIPVSVQVDKAEAKFADGVLTLTLPKADTAKPKQIKIRTEDK